MKSADALERHRRQLGVAGAGARRQARRAAAAPRPIGVTLSLLATATADAAELVPGVARLDARRVRCVAPSAREVLRAALAITKIAGTVVV